MNQNEIICLQYIQQKIVVFDFKFNELFRFDKQVMYGSLETYSMSNYLYSSDSFYYYSIFLDYAKKKAIMNAIKKSDLTLEKSLEIELAGIKSINWIVFNMNELHIKDKCQNFILAKGNDILNLFSVDNGKHLEESKNVNIKKFNSLSICSPNDVFFFDTTKRKLFFI